MENCLFCKMIRKEINAKIEYEDEKVIAIHDINPQAPVHILVIPKTHIDRIGSMKKEDIDTVGNVIYQAKSIAAKNEWSDYRILFNNGEQAGQSVFHIHLHLLSGRRMAWPPG